MKFKDLILAIVVVAAVSAEYVSYKNYKVYKIVPSSDNEVQILMDLQKEGGYDFWSDIVAVGSDVRIMVDPAKQVEFQKYLESVKISARVVIEDVQAQIDEQLQRPIAREGSPYNWTYYLHLVEIYDWLDQIAADHPDVVTLLNIGSSVEGRPIRGVKIDFKKDARPIIGMIEGGIHSREWISPATVTYIINEFLTSTDPDVRLMAENIVWHIFPVVNPDGYAYTFSDNRMWRKNRDTSNFRPCTNVRDDISNGIDLNRNFGFVWMSIGASQDPCTETYAGPNEFSEPESRAISNHVLRIKEEGNMVYYFAFHSYSQMVLVPYSHLSGWDVIEAPNYGDMYEIAIRGMDQLKAQHGTDYQVGTSADILYPVSGSSFDWVKGVAEVPIVFLFELRDVGEYGFLLPPRSIIPNNEEIMAGLVEMEKVTRGMGYYTIENAPPPISPPTTPAPGSSGGKIVFSFVMLIAALLVSM